MSLLFALLAQIGPFPQPGAQPVSPLPPEILERQRSERTARSRQLAPAEPPSSHSASLAACLALARSDPAAAAADAQAWLANARGVERSEAAQCLGMAMVGLERWQQAEDAFLEARIASDAQDHDRRARLATMAGNAAIARNDGPAALACFEIARSDVRFSGNRLLASDIAVDRARALVALGRLDEARDSLAEARSANPGNWQAWLLSATLSRRMSDLAMAQVQIEEAARLMPSEPEIGLEAGVIAVLAGHDEAARRSWQSVINTAPGSDAAQRASAYLAQLSPSSDRPEP